MSTKSQAASDFSTTDTSDLRDQVKVLGEDFKDLARMVRSAVVGKLETAKDATGAAIDASRDKVRDASDGVADWTRDNPWRSLGIAAGVGLLFGIMMRRQ